MRSHHDMGGSPGGTVVRDEHEYEQWENRVDALMALLSHQGPPAAEGGRAPA